MMNQHVLVVEFIKEKKQTDTQLFKKIKHIHQIHNEHNYSRTNLQYSTSESDLIGSLSKIADRIGHTTNSNVSNSLKKTSIHNNTKEKTTTAT